MEYYGEYGGRVLRKFNGDGKQWIAGATLSPADVESWPLANRMSLHRVGKVDWFGPPSADETKARTSTKQEAVKVVAEPKPETTTKTPVRTSRRTK